MRFKAFASHDLVSLAGTGREIDHPDRTSYLIGKDLELFFLETETPFITASSVGSDKNLVEVRIDLFLPTHLPTLAI